MLYANSLKDDEVYSKVAAGKPTATIAVFREKIMPCMKGIVIRLYELESFDDRMSKENLQYL